MERASARARAPRRPSLPLDAAARVDDERNRSHPLARPQVLVDVVHLSRWGHLLTAFFCVAVLHAEGEALWRHSAAQREARWPASLALPPLDPSIEGLVAQRWHTCSSARTPRG